MAEREVTAPRAMDDILAKAQWPRRLHLWAKFWLDNELTNVDVAGPIACAKTAFWIWVFPSLCHCYCRDYHLGHQNCCCGCPVLGLPMEKRQRGAPGGWSHHHRRSIRERPMHWPGVIGSFWKDPKDDDDGGCNSWEWHRSTNG